MYKIINSEQYKGNEAYGKTEDRLKENSKLDPFLRDARMNKEHKLLYN